MRKTFTRAVLLSAMLTAAVLGGRAFTQPDKQPGAPHTMAFPTGDPATSLASIECTAPTEIRVGEPYDFQLKVTNTSKTMTLHSVRVRHTAPAGVEVTRSEPSGQTAQPKGGQPAAKAKGGKGEKAQAKGNMPADGPTTNWSLGTLAPGQTKVITGTAVAHELGDRMACLTVSYEPALCVAVKVVKPVLEVRKEIPQTIDICDPLAVKYVVSNPGEAAAPNVALKDDLPKGLTTKDGKQTIAIPVGDLAPGQTKEFTVELDPTKPGVYSSQAVATSGKQTYESRRTTTAVQNAVLNVTIDGPATSNVGTPTGYTVTVANNGGAVARGTTLKVGIAGDRVGIVHATKENRGDGLTWNFGDIKPKESRQVVFSVNTGPGEVKVAATAQSACAAANNQATTAAASVTTTATAVPALLLSVVDEHDPVKIGTETSYAITVINQGQAADKNVGIVATLPDGLQPVKVDGATAGKIEGQKVTFDAVPELRAGARADWKIIAKATKAGDLRTKVELNSASLGGNPVPDVEPTRTVK